MATLTDASVGVDRERDACGIRFVAHVDGQPRRQIVEMALDGLRGVEHRGAVAADATSGDGAGLLTQIPRPFLADVATELGGTNVDPEALGLGFLFLQAGDRPEDEQARAAAQQAVEDALASAQAPLLGWRDVPIGRSAVGEVATAAMPHLTQVLFLRPAGTDDEAAERVAPKSDMERLAAAETRAAAD